MTSTSTGQFRKGLSCPSSQSLLTYHLVGLPANQLHRVEGHLMVCDFCNAELQLLTSHQNHFEECTVGEMPAHLRRLAEQLLKHRGA